MGRPPMGNTTLGRSDFIRVPLPAARMMAEIGPDFKAGFDEEWDAILSGAETKRHAHPALKAAG